MEFRILGNEVRFGVHFENGTELAVFSNVDAHDTFSSDTGGSLASLVAKLDAKNFFGASHVTIGFGQGLLAFHHRSVGLDAQFFNHSGSNNGHVFLQ